MTRHTMVQQHDLYPFRLPQEPGQWSLDGLYHGATDPMLARDLEAADRYAHGARTRAVIGDLAGAIAALEQALTIVSRISAYAELMRAAPHGADNLERAFYLDRRIDAIEGVGLAVAETIALLPEADLAADMLKPRRAFLGRVRRAMPHPAPDLEGGFARRARRRRMRNAYLDALAGRSIAVNSRPLRLEHARAGLIACSISEAALQVQKINASLTEAADDLAARYLDVLDVEVCEARAAGFDSVLDFRLAEMGLARSTLDAMMQGVSDAAVPVVRNWYQAKAQHLELSRLPHWARFHPGAARAVAVVDWPVALDAVLSAASQMGNAALRQVQLLITQERLDASPRGADAFSHPADGRPYVRAPFRGGMRDAMALAHECGHAAHQGLAFASHGVLGADAPAPLAEAIATLCEALAFEVLVKSADEDSEAGLREVAGEELLHRTLEQSLVHRFESAVLEEVENGVRPDADWLGSLWLSLHREHLSPALAFGDGYSHWWALEPLLVRRPLYAFAYPFAAGLAQTMLEFRRHRGPRRFERAVIDFMRAGATDTVDILMDGFMPDASSSRTWQLAVENHLHRHIPG